MKLETQAWLEIAHEDMAAAELLLRNGIHRMVIPEYEDEAMARIADIGTLIVRTPNIRGGQPHIAGTGVTVRRVVGWYKLGLSPEEIADRIGHLSLAQVYAALAYYHANREEIDDDIAAEEDEAERLEREHYLSRQDS